ncbi:MAG TPA: NifU family protein [Candidatus Thermoplasmatota archaeon]|nr:NifU family protein [Candidatus Thermoplasmatota archaeon]
MKDQVQEAIERIRPALQMDGGDISLVDVDEAQGIVRVALMGACVGCGMSSMTLQLGVERTIKEMVPAVKEVVSI